jgi:hypothetical protein
MYPGPLDALISPPVTSASVHNLPRRCQEICLIVLLVWISRIMATAHVLLRTHCTRLTRFTVLWSPVHAPSLPSSKKQTSACGHLGIRCLADLHFQSSLCDLEYMQARSLTTPAGVHRHVHCSPRSLGHRGVRSHRRASRPPLPARFDV